MGDGNCFSGAGKTRLAEYLFLLHDFVHMCERRAIAKQRGPNASATSMLPAHPSHLPALCPVQRRLVIASGGRHLLCVLVWRLALGAPGVYLGDFLLEGGVDQAVTLQRVLANKLGRHDEGCECLATAS